jgi:hypothetical protein
MKKIIFEEIDRINELMGTESKLLTEQPMFLSKIGDDLWRFVRKAQKGFVQKDIDNIVSKGQRDGIESLTDKELQTFLKHLDFQSLGKKYYDEGLIVTKNSLNRTLTSRIQKLKEDGASTYPEMVQGIRDGAKNNFFGLIPDLGEEYYPFANAFADELIENIDNVILQTDPELWKQIGAGTTLKAKKVPRRPHDISRIAVSPTRAKIQLGWSHWTSLSDGLGVYKEIFARNSRWLAGWFASVRLCQSKRTEDSARSVNLVRRFCTIPWSGAAACLILARLDNGNTLRRIADGNVDQWPTTGVCVAG